MGSPEKPMDVEMGDMSEEAKLNPPDDVKTEEKLLTGEGEKTESRFTGLKKEELLVISNQPKWVRARWVLFIIFWLVWIAMLVGAILIVVNAPRCKPEPKPQWYQDTIVYTAKVEEFDENLQGMENHIPYIESLNAKTVLVSGVSPEQNPAEATNPEGFKQLVTAFHEKGMKVLVDIIVDTLSTSSAQFQRSKSSSCLSDPSAIGCDFFIWSNSVSTLGSGYSWERDETRNASYLASETDKNRAFINYGSSGALGFIKNVLNDWFNRTVDGVQIRDVGMLQAITGADFVKRLWDDYFVNATDSSTRALFVYSSTPDAQLNPVLLNLNDANQTNTAHAPVIINDEISKHIGLNDSGIRMKQTITAWREQSRSIGGYVISPLEDNLAATRFPEHAAGLNLLLLSLPGVPLLRSGDELNSTSGNFVWSGGDLRDSTPLNGTEAVLKQTKGLAVLRVEGIQAMQSLRYDTRNSDTEFVFLNLDQVNPGVVAFKRKWDKKSAVLVVSNLGPSEQTVSLAVEGGLEDEKKLANEAEVLVSSFTSANADDLKSVKLPAGGTMILK